jgi:hypothetical protein
VTSVKPRTVVSTVTAVVAFTGAVNDLRAARVDRDRLALVDALVNLVAVLTGLALAYRSLRARR